MKMRKEDWARVKFFTAKEFPAPEMMEQEVVFLLDAMRATAGKPFVVHASYATSGHGPNSEHGRGTAIDGHFAGLGVIEQYLLAEHFNPAGLGFYPYWNSPGIHVDTRRLAAYEKGSRWWLDERGVYLPITVGCFKRFILKES